MKRIFAYNFFDKYSLHRNVEIFYDDKVEKVIFNASPSNQDIILGKDEVLTYGFVNAHTHLELSHLKSFIPEGQGMLNFIKNIISLRNSVPFDLEKVKREVKYAKERGTNFFFDISNSLISTEVKSNNNSITFLEVYGLSNEEEIFSRYRELFYEYLERGYRVNMVPHSPYSLSRKMWKLLNNFWEGYPPEIISIHFLETEAERNFIEQGKGEFSTFIDRSLLPEAKNAVELLINNLPYIPGTIYLFVHMTVAGREEVEKLIKKYKDVFFVLCPRSNYYISRRLPDFDLFFDYGDYLLFGTDSLASNYTLSVLDEVKFLEEKGINIFVEDVLKFLVKNPNRIIKNFENSSELYLISKRNRIEVKAMEI